MKSKMEYCISRGIKNLPPFVYCEVFKKCASRVNDYAVIEICTDPFDQNNVIFKMIEPEYYKRFNVPTCTWANRDPEKVVLVKMEENQILMVGYEELADIIQQYQLNHPEEFEELNKPDYSEMAKELFTRGQLEDDQFDGDALLRELLDAEDDDGEELPEEYEELEEYEEPEE